MPIEILPKEDGVWLHFKTSTGKSTLLNLSVVAKNYTGFLSDGLDEWIKEQYEH